MFGVKLNSINPYNSKSEKMQTSVFLKKLTCFDVRSIQPKQMKNLEENYIQKKILNVDQLSKVGKPCAQLCTWILSQITLYEYLKNWILIEQQRVQNDKELDEVVDNC